MLSPGQVVYRAWSTDMDMAAPWTELTVEERQNFERIGSEVVVYYAKIMQAEPNVLLTQILSRITMLEGFARDVCQEVKIKGRWRHFNSKEENSG